MTIYKTYLITGGAGFIGSHLVDRLVADGNKVVIIDDFSTGFEKNLEQHVNNPDVVIDRRSITEDVSDLMKDIDGICHLAARTSVPYSVDHPREAHVSNIDGTFNMLELAKRSGVKRFVNFSSSSVYGDQKELPLVETMKPKPISPYALQKMAAEYYATMYHDLYGLETISLRPFNVYGMRRNPDGGYAGQIPKFFKKFYQGEKPEIWGDGEQTRDNTFVLDMVEATIQALQTDNSETFGQVFNIGSSTRYSVNETSDMIKQIVGTDIVPVNTPPRPESRDTHADITKAKKMLNWEPKMNFEEGLKVTGKYYEQFKK